MSTFLATASCCKSNDTVKVVSMDAGPGVASSVDNIMEKVGLKEPQSVSRFEHIHTVNYSYIK